MTTVVASTLLSGKYVPREIEVLDIDEVLDGHAVVGDSIFSVSEMTGELQASRFYDLLFDGKPMRYITFENEILASSTLCYDVVNIEKYDVYGSRSKIYRLLRIIDRWHKKMMDMKDYDSSLIKRNKGVFDTHKAGKYGDKLLELIPIARMKARFDTDGNPLFQITCNRSDHDQDFVKTRNQMVKWISHCVKRKGNIRGQIGVYVCESPFGVSIPAEIKKIHFDVERDRTGRDLYEVFDIDLK